jgi:hypothetical protein
MTQLGMRSLFCLTVLMNMTCHKVLFCAKADDLLEFNVYYVVHEYPLFIPTIPCMSPVGTRFQYFRYSTTSRNRLHEAIRFHFYT